VEVYEHSGHTLTDRAPVGRDGSFAVHVNGTQVYEIRVLTGHGVRLATQYEQFRNGQPVEIRVATGEMEGAPGGPVSVRRLQHKPMKTARRMFREANSLAEAGKLADSAARLEKALEEDPQWFEAWNNLGSRRLTLGNFAGAAEAFRRALAIDPNISAVHANLGLSLLFLQDAAGAEACGRKALQLEPGAPKASYVMGLALFQQNKRTREALEALQRASAAVPRARLAIAEWHCRGGDLKECAGELETFLRTPKGPDHERAARWLGEVKRRM
jgi:tetratricopeptide (TPR) repeat protein